MKNRKILVAEDDNDIVNLIKLYLENEGYAVVHAENGVKAFALFKSEGADLVLADVMMPGMNGYELTKKIREESNVPIIILSAAQLDSNKILGLNLGADDYLTKPFNPLELVARINANMRRFYKLGNAVTSVEPARLTVGEVSADTETMTVYKCGKETPALTATEFKILTKLMSAPGHVYTKTQICEAVTGECFEGDENTVTVHVFNLREKLEDDPKNPKYIKNIRGLGYKFEKTQD